MVSDSAILNKINTTEGKVDDVQSTCDDIETDTQSIETKVDTSITDIGSVKSTCDDIETDTQSIETKVDTTNTRLTSTRAGYLDNIDHKMPFQYVTNQLKTYPYQAAPITHDAWGSWSNGASFTEVVAASTITSNFVIVGVIIDCAGNDDHIVDFCTGAASSEVKKISVPIRRNSDEGHLKPIILPIPLYVPANTRISVHGSKASGNGNIYVKILYYELPLS